MHYRSCWILIFIALTCLSSLSVSKSDNQGWQSPQQGWGGTTKGPLGGWDDEVSNPAWQGQDSGWKLEDSVPGVPGQSYPNYDKIPETSFDCRRQKDPGYYGDVESQCQVFHICQAGGRQNSFLCPVGTIFNQETFVCDWWFNVNCGQSPSHYDRNGNLYRGPDIGLDGQKVTRKNKPQGNSKGGQQSQSHVGIPTWDNQGGTQWGMKGDGNQGPVSQTNRGQGNRRQQRGDMNKGTRRANVMQSGGNFQGNHGSGQKGMKNRGNQGQMGWQNQGSNVPISQMGQKGGNTWQNQGGDVPNNQKGNNQWQNQGGNNQRGGQGGGNVNPRWGKDNQGQNFGDRSSGWGSRGQGLHPNANSKGQQVSNRSQGPHTNANSKVQQGGSRGNPGLQGGQMRRGGANQDKRIKGAVTRSRSFMANSWSMGTEKFQASSGGKGDGFTGEVDPQSNRDQSFHENSPFQGEQGNQNNDWSENFNGVNQFGGAGYQEGVGITSGSNEDWGSDYGSWNSNEQGSNKGYAAENDYDYAYNS